MSAWDRAFRSQPCPHCDAEIGAPCRTPRGKLTSPHLARMNITRAALDLGYEDGLRDALGFIDREVNRTTVGPVLDRAREQIARQLGFVERSNARRSP